MGRARKQKHGPPVPVATQSKDIHPACNPGLTRQGPSSWKHHQEAAKAARKWKRRAR